MVNHDLKCWSDEFDALERGDKVHEFRLNDRDFQVGDQLILRRWDPATSTFTGRSELRKITYVGTGFGIPDGYCVLSLGHLIEPEQSQAARDVLAERRRQIEKEGWTPEHDDEHTKQGSHQLGDQMTDLVAAAVCYLTSFPAKYSDKGWHHMTRWPWDYSTYKPQCGRRGQLVKGAAMILAEIERLDRWRPGQGAKSGEVEK